MSGAGPPSAGPEVAYSNSARLRVSAGPLAGPAVCRLVSILVGRASCPLDRLDDVLLVCDALIDHAPAHFPDGRIALEVAVTDTGLQLRLGPLAERAAEAILDDCAIPGIGNVLTQMTDRVEVEPLPDGEQLVLGLDFHARRPSGGPVPLGQ